MFGPRRTLLQKITDGAIRLGLAIAVLALLFVFVAQAALGAETNDDDSWEWRNPLPQGNSLSGVWTSSGGGVIAVGQGGTVLHHDGSGWSEQESGTTEWLHAVWGDNNGNLFAVGSVGSMQSSGIILHYDGTGWSQQDIGMQHVHALSGVWGSSNSDVFAVGMDTILHYDGNTWREQENVTTTTTILYGVWGSSSTDVFAVGSGGSILHYAGPKMNNICLPYVESGP